MKIIVAGDGKVGSTLVSQLSSEDYDITLIDSNSKVLETTIEQYDVMAITGNCATMDVLEEAGVTEADLLIAATSKDEINLLCCLTAYSMNPDIRTIARVRNPEYYEQTNKLKDKLGLSFMVNPDMQAACEIERILKYPGSLKREYLANGHLEIIELKVTDFSPLNNISLKHLYRVIKTSVLVCIVMRDGKAIAPDGDFTLMEGDSVYVTAPTESLATLLKNLGIANKKIRRVVVCGGNRISYYLAKRLQKSGITVQIIEKNYDRCLELAGSLPEASIVHGDASSQKLMASEHMDKCDALITMTGLDELNMVISLYGTSNHIPQVITSIGHLYNSAIVSSLDLGSVVSPKEICSNQIVSYVRAFKNQTGSALSIHPIANGQAEAMEFLVDEQTLHCGEPLKDIRLKKNVLIAGIRHNTTNKATPTELPNGSSSFQKGDIVIVVKTDDKTIYQLNEIFA